nr:MAG: ABC transporter ATP-binding protein [Hyphomicrobiales bacterium]
MARCKAGKDGTVTALELSSVFVRRGGRNIVNDVSLQACNGEFIALIGANGAGKSTLISVIAGLMKPDHGAIMLNGRTLGEFRGRDLALLRAYLPQNPICEWPISVERLVALGLTPSLPAIGKMPQAQVAKIAATLEAFDLKDHCDQPATTLSGGELTRAMLARALVGDPELLFVDEPIAGLDPRHALDTIKRLRKLTEKGKLVVASLHDLTLAARFATRIVAMHNGRVVADGTPVDILTPNLLRELFDVEARVSGESGGAFVDFLSPD